MNTYPIMLDFKEGAYINVVANSKKEACRIVDETFKDFKVKEKYIKYISM